MEIISWLIPYLAGFVCISLLFIPAVWVVLFFLALAGHLSQAFQPKDLKPIFQDSDVKPCDLNLSD